MGPSFRQRFEDTAPASNADLGKTIAQLLGLKIADKGKLMGRVLDRGDAQRRDARRVQSSTVRSEPDAAGHVTVLHDAERRRRFATSTPPAIPAARSACRRSSNKVRRR